MSATTLYGNTWVGNTAPTSGVLPGQHWYVPGPGTNAGNEYIRDTTNSVWNLLYTSDQANGGLVAQGGSNMLGPLIGAPNLPPLTNPDFIGEISENGFPVALSQDLGTLQQNINTYIANLVRSQFLSQFVTSPTAQNIATIEKVISTTVANITVGYFSGQPDYGSGPPTLAQAQSINATQFAPGTFTGIAIPLPVFPDGTTATAAQLLLYGAEIIQYPVHVGSGGGDYSWYLQELSDTPRLLCGYWNNGFGPSSSGVIKVRTWAIGAR